MLFCPFLKPVASFSQGVLLYTLVTLETYCAIQWESKDPRISPIKSARASGSSWQRLSHVGLKIRPFTVLFMTRGFPLLLLGLFLLSHLLYCCFYPKTLWCTVYTNFYWIRSHEPVTIIEELEWLFHVLQPYLLKFAFLAYFYRYHHPTVYGQNHAHS